MKLLVFRRPSWDPVNFGTKTVPITGDSNASRAPAGPPRHGGELDGADNLIGADVLPKHESACYLLRLACGTVLNLNFTITVL